MPPCCGVDIITTYYSTSAKTTVVGEEDLDGECQPAYQWGQTTPYYTMHKLYCATSTP
jgi:hypothetical protein